MHGRDDGNIRPEIYVVADGYPRVVLDGQVNVAKKVIPDLGMYALMEKHRPLDKTVFSKMPKQLGKQLRPGVRLMLQSQAVLAG